MQLCEDLFATSLAKEFNSWVVQTLSLSFELKFDVAKPSQRLLLPISSGCLVLSLEHLSFIFSPDFLGLVQLGAGKWQVANLFLLDRSSWRRGASTA